VNEKVVRNDTTILGVDAAIRIDLRDEAAADLDGADVSAERTAEHTSDHMPSTFLAHFTRINRLTRE
jgi:hypothetical protein